MTRLDPAALFEEERVTDGLGGRATRGGALMLGSQVARFVLQTAATMILARLLTPDDYGLYGMVAVVVGFANVFRDVGLSTATVQRAAISRSQVDFMVWANLGASIVLGFMVLLAAPAVAVFYSRPEAGYITAALSLTFPIGGLVVQHDAILRRYLRFRELAVVQVVAQAANVVLSVLVALLGWRYWALVAGALGSAAVGSLLTFGFCPLIPGIPKRGTGVRDMLAFGRDLMGFEFINYWARNLDNILVGRVLGGAALGLYSRAYSLFMMPITQIRGPVSQVALPVMSSLKSEPLRYQAFYRRLVRVMALLSVPITMYCMVEAEFIVRFMLGTQWAGMVPVFKVLAILGLVQPTVSTVGLVMQSLGRADRQLRLGIIASIVTVIGFVLGLPFGILGVAWGYVIASYLLVPPTLVYGLASTPIRVRTFLAAAAHPVAAGALAGGATLLAQGMLEDTLLCHVALAVVFASLYIGVSLSDKETREAIRAFRESAKSRSPKE